LAGEILGIGATRIEERAAAAHHKLEQTPIRFECCKTVSNAGVLFLLPALYAQGLFKYKNHFKALSPGYYDIDFIILFLAFMYLLRIKNPEQLKNYGTGEFGKIMGSDRVPVDKTLRKKTYQIFEQKKSEEWLIDNAKGWVEEEENNFYYIDGHIQPYHGDKAVLGKKHVAGAKLCLPGTCQFWVNNSQGMPYFVVTGEVNEKLHEMILKEIIPKLENKIALNISLEILNTDPDLPLFTMVFDREASFFSFFKELWEKHRVAVITYKKSVKDKWNEEDFATYEIEIEGNKVKMELAEKIIDFERITIREIRKKTDTGHQTSLVTTNKKLDKLIIAHYMFARWSQENFFKYMSENYDIDKLFLYAIEQIDSDFKVVNPLYSNLSNKIKKIREKITRIESELYVLIEKNLKETLDNTNHDKQIKMCEEKDRLVEQEENLMAERKTQHYKIAIKDMPEDKRYNKLHTESKLFTNIIKIICYRAETAFGQALTVNYKRKEDEMRMLVKNIITTSADIIPDYQNNTLTISLYSLSTPRDNQPVRQICELLNDTETIYPSTDLRLIYKFATD